MADTDIEWTSLLRVLREYAEAIKQTAIRYLAEDGSNASRTLTNSIDYEYGIDDNHYWIDITYEDYGNYLNEGVNGTEQNRGSKYSFKSKRVNVKAIEDWIRIKPVQVQPRVPTVKSLAIAIQRSMKKKKGFAPPRNVLEDWINKRGIGSFEARMPSVTSLAYAMATSIAKKGIKGTHFLDRALKETERVYKEKIQEAVQDDIHYWLEEVMADALRTLSI